MSWLDDARADGAWRGVRVCVAGIGVSGAAAARVLAARGARVTAVDGRDGEQERARAVELASLGVECRLGGSAAEAVPDGTELLVTSPGWRPDQPLLAAAATAGVPVWGEVELAWRLRDPAVPWLGVTGTNGKTTTVQMLESILVAAGCRAVAAGNVGLPLLDAVLADPAYDVIAVEVSSFQLHWTESVRFHAGAVLNVAPDHLDWHGSMAAYAETKARIWRGARWALANADAPETVRLAGDREGVVTFTLGEPAAGQLGVSGGRLVDRAFGDGDEVVLAAVVDVRPPAPHNLANALAAAGLARALGVPASAVRDGLRAFAPGAHRIALVGTVAGVDYVDDSKATNPHAAAASLAAYGSVVWVAGGLAKGARFEDLVEGAAGRLRGVVLLGRDRALVAEALARHAPDVPVVDVPGTDTGAMDDVVRAAAGLARPGDTVLLAPACASMDMFSSYAERGDAFAAAVGRLST
ncbi:MAG TPA: UDP-N-acetylmuramoyl-L-alanine--D-glutamate ligase [Actinomycetes bacterium]